MCRVAQNWLREHPKVEVLDWPQKGAYMNPIENLWVTMTREWNIDAEISVEAIERKAHEN